MEMNDAAMLRLQILLVQSFEGLTDYFVTHCPSEQVWEDFNPEIDEARDRIAEALEILGHW